MCRRAQCRIADRRDPFGKAPRAKKLCTYIDEKAIEHAATASPFAPIAIPLPPHIEKNCSVVSIVSDRGIKPDERCVVSHLCAVR